jgi:hypothetical protein
MRNYTKEYIIRTGKLIEIGNKLIYGAWGAIGIEIVCLLLWSTDIIPWWGWVLSFLPWIILISIWGGVAIAENIMLSDKYRSEVNNG